ncbi:MAG: ATP-binding cassette domain-containing protein, partial [Treponema sp.]|nr:ATP-binding cassette domain-containing protein [Treponema sp.]
MLQIKDLCYWYLPEKIILNNVNITIAENEFVVIAGRNGCGKTTLLNVISGLLQPRSGGIFLNEKNISKMNINRRSAEIGYVMQDCDTQLFM